MTSEWERGKKPENQQLDTGSPFSHRKELQQEIEAEREKQYLKTKRPWKQGGKELIVQTPSDEKHYYREALEGYKRRLHKEPFNANLHVGKGEALLGLNRYQEALEAYKEAIRLDPDLSSAYKGQSEVYEQLARQSYEKAKELGVE